MADELSDDEKKALVKKLKLKLAIVDKDGVEGVFATDLAPPTWEGIDTKKTWAKKEAETIDVSYVVDPTAARKYQSTSVRLKAFFDTWVSRYNERLETYFKQGKYKEWLESLDKEAFVVCDYSNALQADVSKLFEGSAWVILGSSKCGIIAARNKFALDGFYIRRLFDKLSAEDRGVVEKKGYYNVDGLSPAVCAAFLRKTDNSLEHKCIWETGKSLNPTRRDKEHNLKDRLGKNVFECYTRLDQIFAFENVWKSGNRVIQPGEAHKNELGIECIIAWVQEIVFVGVVLESVLSQSVFKNFEKDPTKWRGLTDALLEAATLFVEEVFSSEPPEKAPSYGALWDVHQNSEIFKDLGDLQEWKEKKTTEEKKDAFQTLCGDEEKRIRAESSLISLETKKGSDLQLENSAAKLAKKEAAKEAKKKAKEAEKEAEKAAKKEAKKEAEKAAKKEAKKEAKDKTAKRLSFGFETEEETEPEKNKSPPPVKEKSGEASPKKTPQKTAPVPEKKK